jgi:RNA polymerase subunit RPABC4/transcription elongation factor Spt4
VLVGIATVLGAVPPFLGPLVYMLFRPPEYLEDVRERELEIKAIERRLGEQEERCTVCGATVGPDFLVCPVCTTKLRQACTSCGRPLDPTWQVCPYCETPVSTEPVPLRPKTQRTRRTTSSG